MTLEQFNLHITVPEGEEKDPELIRLRAELMAIKPLLDDAIQRESVSEAEELHKQALEAKAKLEAYKESLNKKEEYLTIEIKGVQVELGPELGEMSWNEIPAKLEEFNKTLKSGEKPWRVPTKEEFEEIGKWAMEKNNFRTLSIEQKEEKRKEIIEYLGFVWNSIYWSNTINLSNVNQIWVWNSSNINLGLSGKGQDLFVRLVR